MSSSFTNLWLLLILAGVVVFLLVIVFREVLKDFAEKKRGSEQQEKTDHILESDPYLAQEVERLREMIDELSVYKVIQGSVGEIRKMAILHDYNKLDERFFDLYDKNIAQMSKGEVYQELREIEQMIRELKAQTDRITELENQEVP